MCSKLFWSTWVTTPPFFEWEPAVKSAIDKKVSQISDKLITKKSRNTLRLKDKIVTEELKILLHRFVVVPINKASGNVSFVCQRYYAQVLISELGLNGFNGTPKATEPVDKIVSENTSFLKKWIWSLSHWYKYEIV